MNDEILDLLKSINADISQLKNDVENLKSKPPVENSQSNITVEKAIKEYIELRSNILSPSTLRGYRIIMTSRLQSIKDIEITALTLNDIQSAVNIDCQRLSRKSIKSSLSFLKSVLGMHDIDINIKRISVPKPKPKKKAIPEASEVLQAIIGTDLELPCLLAMWLSLRISEVRGLQFRDISEDGKYITVRRVRMNLDGHDVLRDQTKTVDSTRTNPLPRYLYDLIQAVPHQNETDFIYPRSYEYIRRQFRQIMHDNGLDITFHKLRHEFATTLNDLGVPSDYIQKLGGWSTDNIMKSVYTHTRDSKEKEFQAIVDSFFESELEKIKKPPT